MRTSSCERIRSYKLRSYVPNTAKVIMVSMLVISPPMTFCEGMIYAKVVLFDFQSQSRTARFDWLTYVDDVLIGLPM